MASGAGLVVFLVTILCVWFLMPKLLSNGASDPNQPNMSATQDDSQVISYAEGPGMPEAKLVLGEGGTIKRNLSEIQLKSLIFESRENIKAYKAKLKDLEVREERLQIAQTMLKQDIEALSNLRIELASTVTTLRDERDKLDQSLIKIDKTKINNLQQISATYDKMDSALAAKILLTMSQGRNGSSDDAVKILYYMTERVKAEVLASIAETEPAISAYYCSELKQVVVKE